MLLEMVAARETARPMPDDRMTVGKWLVIWLKRQKGRGLRPNTLKAYERSVRLVLPELGSVPARKLRSTVVETILQGLPPYAAANVRAVLSTAMRDAMREGHVLTNEAALARAPKLPHRGLPAPDTATVRAILAELRDHRLVALYTLLAGTGLRIGEATGLRWEDIDDGTPSLTVRYQLQRIAGEHVLTDPKTDTAGRVVFLPPSVSAALRSHKARQATERLAAGRKWRKADLVFTTAEGEPVAESTAHWIISQAAKRAGTRHVSLHDLRRFAASQVEDALGRDAAQLVMGHSSPKMTARYITIRDTMLARAADALEEAIG